jgi:ABC-type branched-subunit amino acid transport system ATPase component/predicted MFS family arabinose efflux permease
VSSDEVSEATAPSPAALAATVLEEEAKRQTAQDESRAETVLPDDLLPGVGDQEMSLREGLQEGGWSIVTVLGLLEFVQFFDNQALAVLAPDIQSSLDVSDAVLGAIGGAFGLLFLLGSVPISSLADRMPRTKLAAISMTIWSGIVFCTGLVVNAFSLFIARMGAGLGQAYSLPVNQPLMIDTYPIPVRGKIFALLQTFSMAGLAVGPVFAGTVATIAGGDEGWRWVFFATAVIALPIALSALFLTEPRRGRHEMRAVLGEELEEDEDELPISLSVAFARLKKIRSFYFFLVGMAAVGFALFTIPLFLNLFLEDEFGLSAFQRGVFGSLTILPAFLAVALAGQRTDRLFRDSPPKAMVFLGVLVGAFGIFIVIALYMPNVVALGVFFSIGLALSRAGFAIMPGVVASVLPYRLRSRGIALIGVYLFVFGSFFGAILTGLLADAYGEQVALTIVVLPATLIGGGLIAYGARYIRHDISLVVEELTEEQEEVRRVRESDDTTPVIQVRNLDFSYGKVQVLFDVAFDVQRGECLALLGTNGAGKSTALRVISGLGVADRGVVRLNGRTITYADPELRTRVGVVQLAGGHATFGPLTLAENLRMAGYLYRGADLDERRARVLEMFPVLGGRLDDLAGDLSGGQQQMLALAMTLMHDPEILIIDELSLGLAPIVVQELIAVVEQLKADGQAMILVEQSLNVALAVADRAVFMEKGRIRFEGPAAELAERDDLARAVFLGADGG